MFCKIQFFLFILCAKWSLIFAQSNVTKDTSFQFTIVFVDNEILNKYPLSSVTILRVDSFQITDLTSDTITVNYNYPNCTFQKIDFNRIRDSIFLSKKKYYLLVRMQSVEPIYIKVPYFSLLHENTLLISRKKISAKTGSCYYTLIAKNSEYLPKSIVSTCSFVRLPKRRL
jgi:hypothetical protein